MNEPLAELIARLRAEYLAQIPDRLAEMEATRVRWLSGLPPPDQPLPTLFHRLAGSAGAYGFGDVSRICREVEQWLATHPLPTPQSGERLSAAITAIRAAFERPPTTEGIEG
jgi:HPt (histidine-containing phosphotransfer) domain-containing protein